MLSVMTFCTEEDSLVSPAVKWMLFITNFLCWLIGGAMVGTGIWAYIEKNKYFHVEIRNIYDIVFDLSIIFLVIGCCIFILGFAGCIGALRDNLCCLKFYYVVIVIILLIEVAACTLAFVFRNRTKQRVMSVLEENLITRYEEDDPDAKDFIDFVQENIKCCGVTSEGYLDWNKNRYYNCSKENLSGVKCSVPHSCCINQNTIMQGIPNMFCGAGVLKESSVEARKRVFTIGCIDKMLILAQENLPFMGGLIIAVAIPQLIAICLARTLEIEILDQIDQLM